MEVEKPTDVLENKKICQGCRRSLDQKKLGNGKNGRIILALPKDSEIHLKKILSSKYICVFVWLVKSPKRLEIPPTEKFWSLAASTDGKRCPLKETKIHFL